MKHPLRYVGFALIGWFAIPALAQPKTYTPQERQAQAESVTKAEAVVKKAGQDLKDAEAKLAKAKAEQKGVSGWTKSLSVGANIALGQSSNVVGRPDGTTVGLGATVNGRLDYKSGPTQWLNSLAVQVQQTRTPLIDAFVKTLDQFKLDSTYVRSLEAVPALGFYAGLTAETSLFGGEDARIGTTDYIVKEPGRPRPLAPTDRASRLLLTKEFAPTLLTQGAGLNYKPLDRKDLRLTIRAGIALVESLVRGGLAIADDPVTPAVELDRLEDYVQAGAQLKVEAVGGLNTWMTYGFTAEFLFPFYSSVDRGLSGAGLISADIALKLGFKMAKWASLDYVLGIRRLPLLADVVQIWNGLLVSFAFNVI